MIETKVHRDPWDVNARLAELGLTREGLLKVVAQARLARRNATGFHCANSAGTFSYHEGVFGLRDGFVGSEWAVDRSDGIEAIVSLVSGVKVSFANVDEACGHSAPKPRSHKGAGAERASGQLLFEDLKSYAPRPSTNGALFYLMVDQWGAAELTRPVIKNNTFAAAVERIFLKPADDEADIDLLGGDDIADGFDPQIVRKTK
jgi:hypothetical protein